jgi:Yip1-like protein
MRLVERAVNIVLRPRREWLVVAAEPTTPARLFRTYVAPLAAVGPLTSIAGLTLVGITRAGAGTFLVPVGGAVGHALAMYLLDLAGIYVLARVIDGLAPRYVSEPDDLRSLQLAAYAATPGWLAGALLIVPALGMVKLLAAAYGFYLLRLGLPALMRTPPHQAGRYFTALVVAVVAIGLLTTAIGNFILRAAA